MKTLYLAITGTLAALALAGCAQVKNPLARTLPDETQVLSGPSLSLPPSFELRPPREGEPSEALLRAPGAQLVSGTGADGWLVQQAQAQAGVVADANVRAELEAAAVSETLTTTQEKAKQGLIQRWMNRNAE